MTRLLALCLSVLPLSFACAADPPSEFPAGSRMGEKVTTARIECIMHPAHYYRSTFSVRREVKGGQVSASLAGSYPEVNRNVIKFEASGKEGFYRHDEVTDLRIHNGVEFINFEVTARNGKLLFNGKPTFRVKIWHGGLWEARPSGKLTPDNRVIFTFTKVG